MVEVLRRQVIERIELSKETKLSVINTMVVPTLLYGSVTRDSSEETQKQNSGNGDEAPQENKKV